MQLTARNLTLVALLGVGGLEAQEPGSEIAAVFAPSDEERTLPGSEKFLIMGREDGVSTIWEYVPGRPSVTKRVSLVESSWGPDLLFRKEPSHLIRQQIPASPGVYRVNLYGIDYRTWKTTRLHASRQIIGLGMSGDSVYLQTDTGLRLLDPEGGRVEVPSPQFRRMYDLGALWFVEIGEGRSAKTGLYDPQRRELVHELDLPQFAQEKGRHVGVPWIQLSPDLRHLAIVESISFDEVPYFGEPAKLVEMKVHLLDVQSGSAHVFPFHTLVQGGSGMPVIYDCLDVGFESPDRLSILDIARDAPHASLAEVTEANAWRRVSIDLSSYATTTVAVGDEKHAEAERVPEFFVPSYLRENARPLRQRSDLVAAFLEHLGVAQNFRGESGSTYCPMAFSEDGHRFYGVLFVKERGALHYYGDLERDELKEIEADGVGNPSVYCVRTPG